MLNDICDFKSYISTHYRVEGFPLYYVVMPQLAHTIWTMMYTHIGRMNVINHFLDFSHFVMDDFYSHHLAQTVPDRLNNEVWTKTMTDSILGDCLQWWQFLSDTFHLDDEIVFHLDHVTVEDSHRKCHFVSTKSMKRYRSHQLCMPTRDSL